MPSLWQHRDFRRLWLGQTASQWGEDTALVVLPLLAVLTLHADATEVGVLRALGQVSHLLLALAVGAWVDAWRTRTVLVSATAVRAVVLCAVAASGLSLPGLFVAVLVVGAMSVFFDVGYQVSVVRVVPAAQLTPANSALEGSRSVAQMGAPALAGVLVSQLPPPLAAASGAVFFAVSFLAVRSLHPHEPESRHRTRIREGLRFVAGQPVLRAVALASAAFQFSLAAFMTALLIFLPHTLGLGAGAIGVVLAAVGPGALVGAVLAARLPQRLGYGRVLFSAALLGDAVALAVPALTGPPQVTIPLLLTINVLFGAGGQLVNVTIMAIRQSLTPAAMQGRVAATITFAGMGTAPLGSLTGGLLTSITTPRTALLAAAAAMLASPLIMSLSPLSRLGRTLPTPSATP